MTQTLDPSVYAFSAPLLDGREVKFDEFRGKVLLVVNTASQCGFTPQYGGLEQLYQSLNARGFEVLGFPCNQFGGQEPGSPDQIGTFCEKNYGVTFPIFAKIDVNGPHAHPFFQFLKQQQPGILGAFGSAAIRWNFTKFLIDRSGTVVARFAPSKVPKALRKKIENLLDS